MSKYYELLSSKFHLHLCIYICRCNAGHEIAQYVVTSLDGSHVGDASRILYACLFFCRQVYSTAEGLLTLLSFSLHNSIARCLSNTNESDWRNTLINNLLNFASTPKVSKCLYYNYISDWTFKNHCYLQYMSNYLSSTVSIVQ